MIFPQYNTLLSFLEDNIVYLCTNGLKLKYSNLYICRKLPQTS